MALQGTTKSAVLATKLYSVTERLRFYPEWPNEGKTWNV